MRKSCFSHAVEMKIDNCDVNDEHLRKMGSMQIQKLELVLCQFLPAKGLQYISNFAWLKELKFSDIFRSIRKSDFVCISKLDKLVRLDLTDTNAGDLLFKHGCFRDGRPSSAIHQHFGRSAKIYFSTKKNYYV